MFKIIISTILLPYTYILSLLQEKKFFQENNNKAAEELHQAEDKVSHLNMVKNKLESTLDDLEDTLDREKRQRGDTEKQRRKVEADLKISQDMGMGRCSCQMFVLRR